MLDIELLARLVESGVDVEGIFVGYVEDIAQFPGVGDVQNPNAIRQAHIQFLERKPLIKTRVHARALLCK